MHIASMIFILASFINFVYNAGTKVHMSFAPVRHDDKLLVIAGASHIRIAANIIVPEHNIITGNWFAAAGVVVSPVEVFAQGIHNIECSSCLVHHDFWEGA